MNSMKVSVPKFVRALSTSAKKNVVVVDGGR